MKYALKKARRVMVYDPVTKKHKCTITEIKSASLSNTQDTIYATGSDGVRLAAYDTTKEATLTFESGVISTGVLQTQTGKDIAVVTNNTGVKIREEFTLASGSTTTVELTYLASGTAGSEIKWIYKADAAGEPGTASAQATTASATEFSYAALTGIITLPTSGFAAGDVVIVDYYPTLSTSTVIENNATSFSVTGDVFVDGYFTDLSTGADIYMQIWCPAGRVGGAFDFSFGDNVAVQKTTIDALASQKVGQVGIMWKITTYDLANAAKAT